MTLHEMATRVGEVEALDRLTGPLARAAKRLIRPGVVKDALSGTPLGHPLHPALTDIPIGAFIGATILDVVAGDRSAQTVDALLALGVAATLPTASAGLADWSDTYGSEQRIGVVHALANVAALSTFAASLVARRTGRRGLGRALGLAGTATLVTGGYLGGHLTYSRGVGVNNAFYQHGPQDWTTVMDAADLSPGAPTKVDVGDATILLYRASDEIYAIGSRCSHAGGPLQDGKVDHEALCVQCPWHNSVFRLEDGSVVHGPASVPQPAYDVRIEGGRVEVRART